MRHALWATKVWTCPPVKAAPENGESREQLPAAYPLQTLRKTT